MYTEHTHIDNKRTPPADNFDINVSPERHLQNFVGDFKQRSCRFCGRLLWVIIPSPRLSFIAQYSDSKVPWFLSFCCKHVVELDPLPSVLHQKWCNAIASGVAYLVTLIVYKPSVLTDILRVYFVELSASFKFGHLYSSPKSHCYTEKKGLWNQQT